MSQPRPTEPQTVQQVLERALTNGDGSVITHLGSVKWALFQSSLVLASGKTSYQPLDEEKEWASKGTRQIITASGITGVSSLIGTRFLVTKLIEKNYKNAQKSRAAGHLLGTLFTIGLSYQLVRLTAQATRDSTLLTLFDKPHSPMATTLYRQLYQRCPTQATSFVRDKRFDVEPIDIANIKIDPINTKQSSEAQTRIDKIISENKRILHEEGDQPSTAAGLLNRHRPLSSISVHDDDDVNSLTTKTPTIFQDRDSFELRKKKIEEARKKAMEQAGVNRSE
ncbi:hypothetical protein PROFUN_05586 [Planoprotostelium fungivorum]|uniref:Uncharacterized protein n=1 Tax=Planoprotostelium fungivorum TaxID=1890364 RepID=A0A2P6N051_9EUKA|nr:hypothetical protein PROFUN_05586 [Planoprotostelium fungivorum]